MKLSKQRSNPDLYCLRAGNRLGIGRDHYSPNEYTSNCSNWRGDGDRFDYPKSCEKFKPLNYEGKQQMILTLNISTLLQAQYARLKTQISRLDRRLALRYGDRYDEIKDQLNGAKNWYEKTKSEAESSGTIPLEQRQEKTSRQFAKAGSAAAHQEGAIKQKLKELWHALTKG